MDAYVRSNTETLNKPTVVTRNSERRGKTEYCRAEDRKLEVGVAEKMSCGAFAPEGAYDGPLPVPGLSHVHVNDVKAYVPGAGGYLYCQKHQDSDPQRSIYACEPW